MVVSHNLKEKLIILAESNEDLANEISTYLIARGFSQIKVATDGSKIYEILRPFYNNFEQIGVVIINEKLPQCQVTEMCLRLSNPEDNTIIPFIIINSDQEFLVQDKNYEYAAKCLVHSMPLPLNYPEFISILNAQLIIKHERFLRYKQEERLINELAERKIVDAKMKYLVVHDELTGLLNRQNFERQLRLILNRSNRLKQDGSLLFIDFDRFSLINELEGYEAGDRLLVDIISMVRKKIAKNYLFARIGSDEFCLFLENIGSQDSQKTANKIRQLVYDYRFCTGDVVYNISVSVGISGLNTQTAVYHPSELISRARQACHMAKENGRNIVWEYNEKDTKVQEKHQDIYWVPLIRKALLEKMFFQVFQPVVDLITGHISHYEVLIRMNNEEGKAVTPNEFIPVAERMGLIHSIDHWVVESAIDFLAQLPSQMADTSLAINLSSKAFQDDTLLTVISEKLSLSWIEPRRITFEITETAAIDSFDQTRKMIANIRALGCKFALDDFGAGFCSFNYLKSFPVDYVKIDGQFIQNLVMDETDQVLVRSMAEIANRLGKKTIAEFVETPETVKKLIEMGVHLGQGYIFGKPEIELLTDNTIVIKQLGKVNGNIQNQSVPIDN